SIDQTQSAWLQGVLRSMRGGLALFFSHHPSSTKTNPIVATGGDLEPRVTGTEVLALLLRHWEVVAWINGHTHRNEVRAHRRPAGGGGLWEISTASHIDWPQQSRLVEIADNRDGTLSIFATVVDHAGPAAGPHDLRTPTGLAGLSRELAANDWQDRTDVGRGGRRDRNVELLVRKPSRARPGQD
ncbi:MAG: hypothetical protein JWR90_695, partial [Marmoricola sp.]|nr:hypothetical protein [Marmoricola sp.]